MNGTWTQIVAVCGGFSGICVAIGWVIRIVTQLYKPEQNQNARIKNLEDEVNELKEKLISDKERLDMFDEGNRITQRALLALLSHGIDGNDIESMKKAKDELQEYLIRK